MSNETKKQGFNLFNRMFMRDFVAVMVGMFFFGFIDNFILVIAGDIVDNTIAAAFGFSTMFSAGIGNTIIYIVSFIYFSFVLYTYKDNISKYLSNMFNIFANPLNQIQLNTKAL
jgi:ABC-type multidrug transport system fused ATPase/permease subunit